MSQAAPASKRVGPRSTELAVYAARMETACRHIIEEEGWLAMEKEIADMRRRLAEQFRVELTLQGYIL